jgi:hypothetical protein
MDFLIKRGNKSIQQLFGSRRAFQGQIFELEKEKEQILIERERLKDVAPGKAWGVGIGGVWSP